MCLLQAPELPPVNLEINLMHFQMSEDIRIGQTH